MKSNEVWVLAALATCSFVANVLHGLTGCGSVLVLHALWQAAITVAPNVLDTGDTFGKENVRGIARFSYVLTFFIQLVLTGLLLVDERRKRALRVAHGAPPAPTELNGVLLLAFIPCSLVGAIVGVCTMGLLEENGLRIILGASSLFFSLTLLALYQMKHLEKKKTEDVIRDDLMLMRIQSEVQRQVILQYMEDQKRERERRERRRRHRAHRRAAKKAQRVRCSARHGRDEMAGDSCDVAAGHGGPEALLPPVAAAKGTPWRELEVHGAPSHSPAAQLVAAVSLPTTPTSSGRGQRRHGGRLQRYWIREPSVHEYVCRRLAEISQNVHPTSATEAREAHLAAWTLRAMEGGAVSGGRPHGTGGVISRGDRASLPPSSSGSSSSSGDGGSASDEDESASVTTATTTDTVTKEHRDTRMVRINTTVVVVPPPAAVTSDVQRSRWGGIPGGRGGGEDDNIDLTKSIAVAAASQPRRVVMGHAEVLNIGLREAQQHQLHDMQHLSASEYAAEHRHHIISFERMDGGVVAAAIVSSFFSGLLGSYTGVSSPPLTIFALAMNISSSVFRMNYAVSSIVPAALRAAVGIADGFANKDLLVHYTVSVLLGWGGLACGIHLSNSSAVSPLVFVVTTLTTMLLVAALMLVPAADVLTRIAATGVAICIVAAIVLRQQQAPEHHRPPAPPNTPSTAAEVEAFQDYWERQRRRQRTAENRHGATPAKASRRVTVGDPGATAPPSVSASAHLHQDTSGADDRLLRCGRDDEELIPIVPSRGTHHV
ncbi:hypothetical protein NESM_000742400 [Novymonas esmeraldas]|uniref:Uncharacterized protein n=1 Tax=Novymonas esmeraldas TaxID=1808958 RepID=A0AAW0EWB3_9TRYP